MKYLFLPLLFVLFNAYSQQAMFHAHNKNVSSAAYVEDVFSAYTYTGNGSTQTITNGIDLAGQGGMVWVKSRSTTNGNVLYDTERGAANRLSSNVTNASANTSPSFTSFNSNGFSLNDAGDLNANGNSIASWTFRQAPKFFDVVTYTGDGTSNRQIAHSLGITTGMVIIKKTSAVSNWSVSHRSIAYNEYLFLNLTDAKGSGAIFGDFPATASIFYVSGNASVNESGATYVAYLFAHDAAADGIIQCGSFTTIGTVEPNATVNLGWEPQYILYKKTNSTSNWDIADNARGAYASTGTGGGAGPHLYANSNSLEGNTAFIHPNATGFTFDSGTPDDTYIYMAIRRGPMKTPTAGTQVYNAIADNHTQIARSITTVGFAPDMMINLVRSNANYGQHVLDRLRGPSQNLYSEYTSAENTQNGTAVTSFDMDGVSLGVDNAGTGINAYSGYTSSKNFFKRAPGFFDEVCYSGTGATDTKTHNLGVVPELIIIKSRSFIAGGGWPVYSAFSGNTKMQNLSATQEAISFPYWSNTSPTSSVFTVNGDTDVNGSTQTYVAYLFATVPGVSKVGSYTGNGANQTIACGFASSARFVLIKRTDAVGDWFVWDTARGIVAGNDPHLSLNTAAVEVTTDDSIDPDSSGFIVNQDAATNINVNSATYIFLAIN